MKNYWIIGDIHGEIGLLDRLLEQIHRFDPDLIVFLGDYIDRGPHSREVIDRISELETEVVRLMGNHEMMMLNAMEDMGYGHSPIELWYYNGGEATLQSFGFTSFFSFQTDMDPHYLAFFQSLKMSHTIELPGNLKILATHAGVSPFIPLSDQMNMGSFGELNRYLLERQIDPEDSFLWVRDAFFGSTPDLWEGYLVVHGHTPVLKLKRFISANGKRQFLFVENDLCIRKDERSGQIVSMDIDSGSVISGRLSGLGLFVENGDPEHPAIRMRSLTVSGEEIAPRDLGLISGTNGKWTNGHY
ncbi:MAG: metallophosphoesterase family protein [Bacteroidota bacterium]